jgi:hypothetical protein
MVIIGDGIEILLDESFGDIRPGNAVQLRLPGLGSDHDAPSHGCSLFLIYVVAQREPDSSNDIPPEDHIL